VRRGTDVSDRHPGSWTGVTMRCSVTSHMKFLHQHHWHFFSTTRAVAAMALIEDWLPPSRENWELVVTLFTYFPVVSIFKLACGIHFSASHSEANYSQLAALQWFIPWYSMGKTSTISRLNIPGKIAWITMESPGFLTLLYIMFTLPTKLAIDKLPWENWALASLFVRAIPLTPTLL
jgi:hypothetical protein